MTSIVPPNFGSGVEVQATQDGARRRAGGVTPLLPQTRKVVGATGFEPATPCAQGRCATRLRYAPTRQEYSEKRAQRHEALRPRAGVALCVAPSAAPSGEGRRIWRALAMISAAKTGAEWRSVIDT